MSMVLNAQVMRRTALIMVLFMTVLSIVPRVVHAGFIPSDESYSISQHDQDMETVQRALENKMVKQRLQAMGYTDAEIQERLDQLSDRELHSLATQIDSVAQGGVIGLIIGILLIVLLVILILKLTDKRIIIS